MSVSYTLKTGALAACVTCLLTGLAMGQQQTTQQNLFGQSPTERPPAGQFDRPPSQPGQASQEVEQYLAQCLLAKNKAEVQISEIAAQEAKNPQVKQFAEKMVREHRELSQQLTSMTNGQTAGQRNNTPPGRSGIEGQPPNRRGDINQPGENLQGRQPDTQNRLAGSQNQALQQLTQIEQQITQKATEAISEKLRDKSDVEFDQAYLGCQVGAHMQMKVALGVIEQQTSGELAQFARQNKQKVEQHLQEAERLMEQTAQNARQASRRSTTQQQ